MRTAALALLSFALQAPPGTAPPPPADTPRFGDSVEVERVVMDVRVVDSRGQPVRGLGPTDFRVLVDGTPVSVESVQWNGRDGGAVAAEPSRSFAEPSPAAAEEGTARVIPRGRLIVFLFQRNNHPSRAPGFLRMRHHAVEMLDKLDPADRVAVFSFDSHLKLWSDFSTDRDHLRRVLDRSIVHGRRLPEPEGEPPVLRTSFDEQAAKDAGTPEAGLGVLGKALMDVPGAKSLVMFGWGMGQLYGGMVTLDAAYGPARRRLADARVTVFSLDITNADYHTLEVGLQQVAADTGGFYARTHMFASQAMTRLEGALEGFYVISFEKPAASKHGRHDVQVKLARGHGDILRRHSYVD